MAAEFALGCCIRDLLGQNYGSSLKSLYRCKTGEVLSCNVFLSWCTVLLNLKNGLGYTFIKYERDKRGKSMYVMYHFPIQNIRLFK